MDFKTTVHQAIEEIFINVNIGEWVFQWKQNGTKEVKN